MLWAGSLFKDKGLFATIKRFFKDMIAKFTKEYENLTPDQQDAQDIRQMKDMFDNIQKAFAEALVEASDNFQAKEQVHAEIGSAMGTLHSDRSVTSWNIAWDSDNYSSLKSQMIEHQDEINAMSPVTDVVFDKSKGKTYAAILNDILRTKFGYRIERQDGASFLFDETAIGTLRHYVTSDEEAAAVIAAPYVLKRGKVISGHKNHKENGYPSVTYAAPVTINGDRVNVGVAVLFADKDRPHSLRVLMPSGKEYVMQKIKTDPGMEEASPKSDVPSPTGSVSKNSIRNDSGFVNSESTEAMDVEMDAKTESVAPAVMKSERIWTESDYVQERNKASHKGEKFSLRESVEETKDLLAYHNITPKLLADVLRRNGLLMPSLAVTNKGMTDFGSISLLFDKATIDPGKNEQNKLYGADAWTPTQTNLKKNAKFDTDKTVNAVNSIKSSIGSKYVYDLFNITAKQFRDTIIKADGSIYDAYAHNIGMQTAYAMEKGIISEIPTKNGSVDKAALQKQLNSELDTDNGWRQYKKWLNTISDTVITCYDQATNEDILKNMKAQPATAKQFKLSETGELVVPAVEYSSIDEVRKNKSRLSENAAEATKAVADEFLSLAKKIDGDTKAVVNAINAAFANRYSTADIVKAFKAEGIKIAAETAGELQSLYKKAVELPTQYFEAKPGREVGLEEVKAVVMPTGTEYANLKSKLEALGIQVVEYSGTNESRVEALNSVENLKFSERGYSYDAIISKPDMAITTVEGDVPNNRADVVAAAKKNAASVGSVDPKTGSVSVYVDDIGANVLLGTDGLKHGLRRTKDPQNNANYIVTVKAGEIIKNSIKINEMNPKKVDAKEALVLIGVAKNTNGDIYVVRSIVNRFSNELTSIDALYAINAKKQELAAPKAPRFTAEPLSETSSTISIADLLDIVNQYFPDILPEDVLRHYGYDARPDGDLGREMLYQERGEDTSNRALLANAFEGLSKSSVEYQMIQDYKEQIKVLNLLDEQLSDLNAEIQQNKKLRAEQVNVTIQYCYK